MGYKNHVCGVVLLRSKIRDSWGIVGYMRREVFGEAPTAVNIGDQTNDEFVSTRSRAQCFAFKAFCGFAHVDHFGTTHAGNRERAS